MRDGQDNEKPRYSTLDYSIRAKLDISWAEYVLLDMVYHLSAKYEFCYKSTSAISRDLGQHFSTTSNMVKRLVARELLIEDPRGLKCANAYIDVAYLRKDDEVTQITKTRDVHQNTKTSPKRKQNHQNANEITKTHDKNNNRITIDFNNLDKSKLASKPPMTEKDEISVLYYQVMKALGLPTRNHNNVKSKIAVMCTEAPHHELVSYLNFMLNFYQKAVWEFKPSVTEALDIYAKRVQIVDSFKRAQAEQVKHQPVRFGGKR